MFTFDFETFTAETGITLTANDIQDLIWLMQDAAARLDTCRASADVQAFIRCLTPAEQ